jgi:hypothetical protein
MSCIVGLSIEKDGIAYSVLDSKSHSLSENSHLTFPEMIKYFNVNPDFISEERFSERLTSSSLNLLRDIKHRYGDIDVMNFCILRTDESFQRERDLQITEKEEISSILKRIGVKPKYNAILRFRLWEDLGPDPNARYCIYSGEKITINNLFDERFNIDHVVPKSYSNDNSRNNMVICLKDKNIEKADNTPWEIWHKNPEEWKQILQRSKNLPLDRFWRFSEQAGDISRYIKSCEYLINTPQRNFAGSLIYLCEKTGLVNSLENVNFLNSAVHNIVKKGITLYSPIGEQELNDMSVNALVSSITTPEAQNMLLRMVQQCDKKNIMKNRIHRAFKDFKTKLYFDFSEETMSISL